MKPFLIVVLAFAAGIAAILVEHGCSSPNGEGALDAGLPDARPPGMGPKDGERLAAARAAIQHVVIINQENRSFDHYFGTFPGADGIPMDGGAPTVCSIDPDGGACIRPFHNRRDENVGGPHSAAAYATCVADGRMNGFIESLRLGRRNVCRGKNDPTCTLLNVNDVMGYHDDREIPNYWTYAKAFALQDHMFESVASYSLPEHLYMVSGWSAFCTPRNDPSQCVTDLENPGNGRHLSYGGSVVVKPLPEYAWTDITHLLHESGVSWKYFVTGGREPDCEDGEMRCEGHSQDYEHPSYWNVLPWFDDVIADGEVANIVDTEEFFADLKAGKMANVNWLIPSDEVSEHPRALVSWGQAHVTRIINAVMESALWNSTVIFLTWDDWGGFYDHVVPVRVDASGYGLRVPGLTISPWVKSHTIDHRVYSQDAYLRFIEDIFLNGARLDPAHDGRRDSRPTVRENEPELGNLLTEFDFEQEPNPALVLSPCPSGVDTVFSDTEPCR
jgi:phospholipase C